MKVRQGLLAVAVCSAMVLLGLTVNQEGTLLAKQPVTSKDVSREANEAMEVTREYSIQKRKEFQAAVKERLDHLRSQIQALHVQVGTASDQVKREFNQSFRALEKQKAQTYRRLDDLDRASSQTWGQVKSRLSEAMDQLKHSYDEVVSSLTE